MSGPPREPEVVVITGASAGVGRATAVAFARRGARIGLLARGKAGLEAARDEVEALGGSAMVIPTDVANAEAVEEAAAAVEEAFGPLDVWINNAMLSVFSPVRSMQPEEYRRVTEVTYLGYVHGVLSALRRMEARDRGVIVNVGSALAFRGIPLQSAYCAAKHAVQGFTESLRCELLHDGSSVRITEVHLPALNTPQFGWVKSRLPERAQPVPPIYQPEVAAEAIVFAVDHDRRQVWASWSAWRTALGNRVAPWYVDRVLARVGYESQQTGEPEDGYRRHNLWEPVDGDQDRGAHGAFGERATDRSLQLWATRNRRTLAVVTAGVAAGLATLLVRNGRGA